MVHACINSVFQCNVRVTMCECDCATHMWNNWNLCHRREKLHKTADKCWWHILTGPKLCRRQKVRQSEKDKDGGTSGEVEQFHFTSTRRTGSNALLHRRFPPTILLQVSLLLLCVCHMWRVCVCAFSLENIPRIVHIWKFVLSRFFFFVWNENWARIPVAKEISI